MCSVVYPEMITSQKKDTNIMHVFIPMKKLPTATDQEKGFNTKTRTIYRKPRAEMDRQKLRDLLAQYVPDQPLTKVPIRKSPPGL